MIFAHQELVQLITNVKDAKFESSTRDPMCW